MPVWEQILKKEKKKHQCSLLHTELHKAGYFQRGGRKRREEEEEEAGEEDEEEEKVCKAFTLTVFRSMATGSAATRTTPPVLYTTRRATTQWEFVLRSESLLLQEIPYLRVSGSSSGCIHKSHGPFQPCSEYRVRLLLSESPPLEKKNPAFLSADSQHLDRIEHLRKEESDERGLRTSSRRLRGEEVFFFFAGRKRKKGLSSLSGLSGKHRRWNWQRVVSLPETLKEAAGIC